VDPRAFLDDLEKRKFLTLLGLELRPLGRPAHSQSLSRLHVLDCTKDILDGNERKTTRHCLFLHTGLVMWDLWWTKWRWGRFSPSTSVSPTNLRSTNFFSTITITYHPGLVQEASNGRSTKSPTAQIKKNI
jgi:hypothetical protein